jgi:hypothetical protein
MFDAIKSEQYGEYIIEYVNVYDQEKQLVAKTRYLKNKNGETLCFQEINMLTEEPIFEETTKYIGVYDNSEQEDGNTYYCRFHYNPDGTLFYCEFNFMSDYDSEEFHQNNIVDIRNKFVLSDSMYNYYLTADFLPPMY